jgi:antitoxin ParD1/3/4
MSKSETLPLPPRLAKKLRERVESGEFDDMVDAVRGAVEALERQDQEKLEWLREKVRRSLADPRPSIPAEEVFAEMEAMIDEIEWSRS